MNIRKLGWLIGLSALASSFISCTQAKVDCTASQASSFVGFASKYTLKNTPAAGCEALVVPGDVVGFGLYTKPLADEAAGQVPDRAAPSDVTWQTESLGLLRWHKEELGVPDSDEAHKAYAFGTFAAPEPNESNYCPVNVTGSAEQSYPAFPGDMTADPPLDPEPALSVRYDWQNFQLYVTAGAPGTQFSGDLTYTEDGCTLEYSVVGLWPGVFCGEEDENGNYVPNDIYCAPEANLEAGLPVGSGINPDIATVCDPDLLHCIQADGKVAEVTDE